MTITLLAALVVAVGLVGILVPILPGSVLVLGGILLWTVAEGGATAWTVFALATGVHDLPAVTETGFRNERSRPAQLNHILDAAAACFAAACTQAVVSAATIGAAIAYRDLCPTAFRSVGRALP